MAPGHLLETPALDRAICSCIDVSERCSPLSTMNKLATTLSTN